MSGPLTGGGTGQTPVHPDDLAGLRHRWVTTQGQIDELERQNVLEGRRWATARRRTREEVLDDAFLRELHRRMFGEVWDWAGSYRTRATSIGIDAAQVPVRIRDLLLDARMWLEHGEPAHHAAPLARLHHHVAAIHPFAIGNGRVARALVDLVARCVDMPDPTWGLGVNNARERYLAALRAADRGDIEPLVQFMWRGETAP